MHISLRELPERQVTIRTKDHKACKQKLSASCQAIDRSSIFITHIHNTYKRTAEEGQALRTSRSHATHAITHALKRTKCSSNSGFRADCLLALAVTSQQGRSKDPTQTFVGESVPLSQLTPAIFTKSFQQNPSATSLRYACKCTIPKKYTITNRTNSGQEMNNNGNVAIFRSSS